MNGLSALKTNLLLPKYNKIDIIYLITGDIQMNNSKSWNDLEALQTPDYDSYNNVLLIDGNNLSYRWLQRPNHGNFAHDFIRTVQSLSKSYEASRTIVCFDFGKSYYRMDMSEEYKANRKKYREQSDIDWSNVNLTLLDDRKVSIDHPDSNEKLLIDHFAKNSAQNINIVSLCNSPNEVLEIKRPFDIMLIGLGGDGHFASLFPELVDNKECFDVDANPEILFLGEMGDPKHERVSMNLSLILQSKIEIFTLMIEIIKYLLIV